MMNNVCRVIAAKYYFFQNVTRKFFGVFFSGIDLLCNTINYIIYNDDYII